MQHTGDSMSPATTWSLLMKWAKVLVAMLTLLVYLGLRAAYPTPDKSVDTTTMAIRTFAGDRKIDKLYADRSGEISSALKTLGIMPQGVSLGYLKPTPWPKKANGDVLAGTRALLLPAGLPYYFWEYAMSCYCTLDNLCRAVGEGVSPWSRTHGRYFTWKLVPFWEQGILQIYDRAV